MDAFPNHPSEPFRRGTRHLFAGAGKPRPERRSDLRAAIAALTEHLRLHPQDLAGLAARALALLEKLDFSRETRLTDARQAEADLTRVLAVVPGVSDVWKARGWVRSLQGVKESGEAQEALLRGAAADLREAIRLGQRSAWCYKELGQTLLLLAGPTPSGPGKIETLQGAISAYVEACRLDPKDDHAAQAMTTATMMMATEFVNGESAVPLQVLPVCIAAFEEFLLKYPKRVDLHMNCAQARGFLGLARAMRNQDPVPDFERALGAYSTAWEQKVDLRAGLAAFGHTLESLFDEKPDLPERPRLLGQYHYVLALFASSTGGDASAELLQALPLLEEAVKRQPGVASLHAWLGMTFRNLLRFEEALGSLEEASRLMPGDANVVKAIEEVKRMRDEEKRG